MSSTSNVPQLTITSTGVSVPQTTDVLTGVLSDMDASFGGNLNTATLATPQGYLSENLTYYITQLNSDIVYLMSMFDPATAEGRWQDAIGRLYFLTRNPATATVVACTLIGQAGVTIPSGVLATDGINTYASSGPITFSSGGLATGTFLCTTLGALACPAGTLNRIAQAVAGWDSITNPADGIIGNDVENRVDFEFRRQQSVASNGTNSVDSITGAVVKVANVLDCYVYENFTGSPVTVGATSYSVVAHSIYVAVLGGTDLDVATAIWTKKSIGCAMNGNTTVTVTDTGSLAYPQPTYTITFERPISLPIYVTVNIGNHPNVPATITALTRSAITAAFNGTDGGDRVRIGSDLYASRFYAGLAAISPTVKIISVFIGTSVSPTGTEVLVGIDKIPTITDAQIVVNLV